MSTPFALVQKRWNCCNILRDDGLSFGVYVERLTFLLLHKMANGQARSPSNKPSPIVAEVERRLSAEELEVVVSPSLQRAACLRQSTLQKAFTGEIRL